MIWGPDVDVLEPGEGAGEPEDETGFGDEPIEGEEGDVMMESQVLAKAMGV